MLYRLTFDSNQYLDLMFDSAQIKRIIGDVSDETIDKRIDMNAIPRSYQGIINEPLKLTFPVVDKADKKKTLPDLVVCDGRLFLNEHAYTVLEPFLKNDGEFLPVDYENGEGYFYTPLQVAEKVNALDTKLSSRNAWGDIDNLVFDEDKVKAWSVFRTEFDGYMGLFCQESVKESIEKENLTGMYITNDLANIFPEDLANVTKLN